MNRQRRHAVQGLGRTADLAKIQAQRAQRRYQSGPEAADPTPTLPAISIGKEAGMASPEEIAWPQSSGGDGIFEAFRPLLRRQYGESALRVFDHRLAGNEVRELIGQGMTSYAVKEAVKQIKAASREAFSDDPELASIIDRALWSKAETVRCARPCAVSDLDGGHGPATVDNAHKWVK